MSLKPKQTMPKPNQKLWKVINNLYPLWKGTKHQNTQKSKK